MRRAVDRSREGRAGDRQRHHDIAIWDPAREVVVSQSVINDRMDYSPFEGMRIVGWPVTTMSRGEVIVQNGEVRGREGRGQFIERLPPS